MPNVKVIDIPWSELKARWLQARSEGTWKGQPILERCARSEWAGSSNARWTGGSGADTERWLREGFHAESFKLNELNVQPRKRKRASWSEDDGETDVGRLYGGSDAYMLTSALRESMPGVTLEIEYDFGAAGDAKSIAAYGQWLVRLIGALEAQGYDLDVVLIVRSTALFRGEGLRERSDIRINVKRAGEVSDFTSWSAIFAPTGFRHLFFAAFGMAADALGKTVANGLGGPVTSGWAVKRDEHVISITCDSRGACAFPLQTMTDEAREAGLI